MNPEHGTDQHQPKPKPKKIVIIIAAALAVVCIAKGIAVYRYSQSHVSTDDAYVTGDLIYVSANTSGELVELSVEDGQYVHKGDLLAKIKTDAPESELAQAQAGLKAVESSVPQAAADLKFTQIATSANIQRSMAGIKVQSARTSGAKYQVALTNDTVRNQISQAEGALSASKALVAQAQAGIETARAAVQGAQQAAEAAHRQSQAADSQVKAAEADAARAKKDLERYKKLLDTEAISQHQYDSIHSAEIAAAANFVSAKERAESAKAQTQQAQAAIEQAKAQLKATIKQAEAAEQQSKVAEASLDLAKSGATNINISDSNEKTMTAQNGVSLADLSVAQAGHQQVAVKEKQLLSAKANVEQARAAVQRASIRLKDCYLYAPCDGYVVKRSANVGNTVAPGQTIVTLTKGSEVWVMANFKETQIGSMIEGQIAEIDIDSFPGKVFKGKVQSIIRATGSATTLLPPDNSTGNFTKIVQRVPVKIALSNISAEGTAILRQGMSAVATVAIGKR